MAVCHAVAESLRAWRHTNFMSRPIRPIQAGLNFGPMSNSIYDADAECNHGGTRLERQCSAPPPSPVLRVGTALSEASNIITMQLLPCQSPPPPGASQAFLDMLRGFASNVPLHGQQYQNDDHCCYLRLPLSMPGHRVCPVPCRLAGAVHLPGSHRPLWAHVRSVQPGMCD